MVQKTAHKAAHKAARIVITEFMDERAVDQLRAKHEVLYDPTLVDDAVLLHAEAAGAEAIVVRNRTQVRGELLAALATCRVVGRCRDGHLVRGLGLCGAPVPYRPG